MISQQCVEAPTIYSLPPFPDFWRWYQIVSTLCNAQHSPLSHNLFSRPTFQRMHQCRLSNKTKNYDPFSWALELQITKLTIQHCGMLSSENVIGLFILKCRWWLGLNYIRSTYTGVIPNREIQECSGLARDSIATGCCDPTLISYWFLYSLNKNLLLFRIWLNPLRLQCKIINTQINYVLKSRLTLNCNSYKVQKKHVMWMTRSCWRSTCLKAMYYIFSTNLEQPIMSYTSP